MPLFHGKGARPFKFKFELSDVRVHLNSSSSVAVAVDNVSLTWERGPRSVSSKKGRVVEKLNSVTGELSRTAPLLGSDLVLPATLFRTGSDEAGRWGSKTSEFKLFDADAEEEEALLCTVTFELSTHAASASQPVLRTRLEVPLTSGLGSMSFALCSRMLSSSGGSTDDGCSYAGSDGVSNASEQVNHRDLDDAIAEAAEAPAFAPPSEHQQVANSMEARWQEVYELERSKQDALTIEKLHRDLGDLIVDKQRLSEENLRLKSILKSSDAPKKELLERVAELEVEVTKLKREAAVNEEQLATSYQSVIRQLEVELDKVTSQRDDAVKAAVKANERRNILDALRKDNTKPLPLISDSDSRNGSTHAQTHAQQTNAVVDVPTVRLVNGVAPGSVVLMPVMAGGTGGLKGLDGTEQVLRNFAAGLTHVHTAFDYYNLPEIGRAIAQYPRANVFISAMTSPCFHASPPVRNVTDPDGCYNLTTLEIDSVLHDLGVTYVDLIMLHGPSEAFGHEGPCSDFSCPLNAAQWRAYAAALAANKTRAIGVSNFCISCLECLAKMSVGPVPATNQLQLHVGMGPDPGKLMSYNAAHGIVVQAYEPLAGGDVATNCTVCAQVGTEHNKSAAQVGLLWVLDRVPSLVVETGSQDHLDQDLAILDGWSLSLGDRAALDGLTEPKGEAGGRCSWGCTE